MLLPDDDGLGKTKYSRITMQGKACTVIELQAGARITLFSRENAEIEQILQCLPLFAILRP
jgi:hypothetical protein